MIASKMIQIRQLAGTIRFLKVVIPSMDFCSAMSYSLRVNIMEEDLAIMLFEVRVLNEQWKFAA